MKQIILTTVGGIALIVSVAFLGIKALDGKEQSECRTWADEATKYPGFYLTNWQSEQCSRWKIEISAPIK